MDYPEHLVQRCNNLIVEKVLANLDYDWNNAEQFYTEEIKLEEGRDFCTVKELREFCREYLARQGYGSGLGEFVDIVFDIADWQHLNAVMYDMLKEWI
jgi:hypothetical protein